MLFKIITVIFSWIFLIALLSTAFFIFRIKMFNKKEKKQLIWSAISSVIALIIVFTSLFNIPDIDSDSSNQSEKYESSSSSSSSSSSDEKSNASSETNIINDKSDERLTSTEIKEINKQLASDLKDDQNDAISGNEKYNWAPYLLKIKLNKDKQAYIWVDGNFVNLTNAQKQYIAEKANGLIGRSIVTAGVEYSPEESREGIYMAFYNGSHAIGHSRFTDHGSIKWYE